MYTSLHAKGRYIRFEEIFRPSHLLEYGVHYQALFNHIFEAPCVILFGFWLALTIELLHAGSEEIELENNPENEQVDKTPREGKKHPGAEVKWLLLL